MGDSLNDAFAICAPGGMLHRACRRGSCLHGGRCHISSEHAGFCVSNEPVVIRSTLDDAELKPRLACGLWNFSDVQRDLTQSLDVPSLCHLRLVDKTRDGFWLDVDTDNLSHALVRTIDGIYVVPWACQHCLDSRTVVEVKRDQFRCPLCNLTDVCRRCRAPHTLTAEQAEQAECDPGTRDVCYLCVYNMSQSLAVMSAKYGTRYTAFARAMTQAINHV